ncbi:alpha/beta hydrolase [Fischerella thermalis]|uniref:alpha/beta hydrolase n=1 Tax=Fischerella thermalis TaxID=372787 RepID=UPI0019EF8BBA|nr:alpha/beta hydrolase [Fischerella thermalis]MBF1991085.1 alpha/beta hydrolase [Fischerella thermalis M58_A2018_009]MBF2059787.1 alpha/beta hydrolase [Fischerella thermalis M66_A2018_004]MBF2069515.1 alpha/beta hydrolase [Fischerella thermalis M48_A2018_028]
MTQPRGIRAFLIQNRKSKIQNRIGWFSGAFLITTCLIPTIIPRPVLGAERLTLSYGLLERSISVQSLEDYARTGKIDDELAAYFQYAPKERLEQIKQVLLTPIPLNVVQVSQFLYTPIGERLLENLATVIEGETRATGLYGIRAALILAAVEPEGLTLLNVLRKFPSSRLSINLARALQLANLAQSFLNQTQQAIALIQKEANQEATTASPESISNTTNLLQPGSYQWQKQTINLNDQSRDRIYPADIYLPQASQPRPVIVISHGLGSDRTSFVYLAEYLASYGFVVAVPEHPGSNAQQLQALLSGRAADITSPREFIDRPLDVRYLLDELARRSRSEAAFRGRLNLEQVGVIGQSFGGYTALALAGAPINFSQIQQSCPPPQDTLNVSLLLQCLTAELSLPEEYDLSDSRIKAAIAINPINSIVLGKDSLSQIKIPVMIVSSSNDTAAPALPEQIQPFTWLTTTNKYLALISGGTHFSTIAESPNSVIPVPEQVIGPNPALAQRYVKFLSLPFFQSYVANQPSYLTYLNADYIHRISQQPLPLSLVRSLNLKTDNTSLLQVTADIETEETLRSVKNSFFEKSTTLLESFEVPCGTLLCRRP